MKKKIVIQGEKLKISREAYKSIQPNKWSDFGYTPVDEVTKSASEWLKGAETVSEKLQHEILLAQEMGILENINPQPVLRQAETLSSNGQYHLEKTGSYIEWTSKVISNEEVASEALTDLILLQKYLARLEGAIRERLSSLNAARGTLQALYK